MSKDQDDKNRHISKLKNQIEEHKKEQKKIAKKINRLKSAKKNIQKEVNKLESLQKDIVNLKNNLDSNQFKGTLREKFNSKVDSLDEKIQTEQNDYQQSLSKISIKIARLEAESGDIGGIISSLSSSLVSFMQSLN